MVAPIPVLGLMIVYGQPTAIVVHGKKIIAINII